MAPMGHSRGTVPALRRVTWLRDTRGALTACQVTRCWGHQVPYFSRLQTQRDAENR